MKLRRLEWGSLSFGLLLSLIILIIGAKPVEASYLFPPQGGPQHVYAPAQGTHGLPNDFQILNGRYLNVGYFTGESRLPYPDTYTGEVLRVDDPRYGNDWYPGCVNPGNPCGTGANSTVEQFITAHRNALFVPSTYRTAMGSSYVILSMLGRSGQEFGCNRGSNYGAVGEYSDDIYHDNAPGTPIGTKGNDCIRDGMNAAANIYFNEWASRVRQYDAAGLVDWNIPYFQGYGETNTSSFVSGHRSNQYNGGDRSGGPYDVVQWNQPFSSWVPAIRFRSPPGHPPGEYVINRECLNSKGFFPLIDLDYNNRAQITGLSPPSSPPPSVSPSQTNVSINAWIRNFGNLASPNPSYLRIQITKGATFITPHTPPNYLSGPAPTQGTGFDPIGCNGRAPCWFWGYPGIAASGAQGWVSFNFDVSAAAPPGVDIICFRPYAHRNSSTNPEFAGSEYCLDVVQIREPFLSTAGGSVQAGVDHFDTNPCLVPGFSSGNVRGRVKPPTGSRADYVVSAGGNIDSFGSAGAVSSPTSRTLQFGNQGALGGYGRVCRQDLAKRYIQDLPAADLGLGNAFTVAQLNAKADGIYKVVGNVTLTGGNIGDGITDCSKRITLVVQGDINIISNIGFCPSFNRNTIPSFGVIASGNINIAPAVTGLYGIYYAGTNHNAWNPGHAAGGVINTCRIGFGASEGPPALSTPAGTTLCGQALNVQGAMVATRFYFRRTFGSVSGTTPTGPSEFVNYVPQLLLRPPLGLGSVSVQIRSQSERPPVF